MMMWAILFFANFAVAMEQPAPTMPIAKKYSCCPQEFGYALLPHIPQFVTGRQTIRFADFAQTQHCDDSSYSIRISRQLFALLLLDANNETTGQAQESVKQLRIKLFENKIHYHDKELLITQKDLVHRLLPHIAAFMETVDNTYHLIIDTQGRHMRINFVPCIHRINNINFMCDWRARGALLGLNTIQLFETLASPTPILSLKSQCLKVVAKYHKERALSVLPEELKIPLLRLNS